MKESKRSNRFLGAFLICMEGLAHDNEFRKANNTSIIHHRKANHILIRTPEELASIHPRKGGNTIMSSSSPFRSMFFIVAFYLLLDCGGEWARQFYQKLSHLETRRYFFSVLRKTDYNSWQYFPKLSLSLSLSLGQYPHHFIPKAAKKTKNKQTKTTDI